MVLYEPSTGPHIVWDRKNPDGRSARNASRRKSVLSTVAFDPTKILRAYVDLELGKCLSAVGDASIGAVLLHEVLVDLCLSFGQVNLLNTFAEHVRDRYHTTPGFVTRNFVRFVEFSRDNLSMEDSVIMAPFNSVGFQMNPSKKSCENCLATMSKGRVFAISVLAAGYLKLNEAVEYLKALPNVSGVAVGVSSVKHAVETFTLFKTLG